MTQIIEKFLSTLHPYSSIEYGKFPIFRIGFIGIIGAGKTTVAQSIQDLTGLYVFSNDRIRRFLDENNIVGDNVQKLVQDIAEASSRYLLSMGVSHIHDADFLLFYERAYEISAEFRARFFIVYVTCDENLIIKRLKSREGFINTESKAGVDRYFMRKGIYQDALLPSFNFSVDTSLDITNQIKTLSVSLKKIIHS